VINNLLSPMVGILKVVGYLLAGILVPVLELLRPVIEGIAEVFIWLYNTVLRPVANFIIVLFNGLYNFFVGIINTVRGWFGMSMLPTKDLAQGLLPTIDMVTLGNAGTASGGGGGGGSASYAAGTTIKVEMIQINAGAIVGDPGLDDLAIIIRDKIQEAERIGR